MYKLDFFSPVEQPTDWMVVVPKKDSSVRICVDLSKFNHSVMREKLQLPTVDEASFLTIFVTPFGRFRFNRLPFGISSASFLFPASDMANLVKPNVPFVLSHIDGILVVGSPQQEHDEWLHSVLKRLQEAGVTLNKMFEFNKTYIVFLGHVVNAHGIKPEPSKTQAI